jgi:8-oxo-dGTP pyrophosphatase MutT (NUDIX family)
MEQAIRREIEEESGYRAGKTTLVTADNAFNDVFDFADRSPTCGRHGWEGGHTKPPERRKAAHPQHARQPRREHEPAPHQATEG